MRQTNQDSVAIYHVIVKPTLTSRELLVLQAYEGEPDLTLHEVAHKLNLPVNTISGRITALLEKGKIEVVKRRTSKFCGIPTRSCRKRPQFPEQDRLFS